MRVWTKDGGAWKLLARQRSAFLRDAVSPAITISRPARNSRSGPSRAAALAISISRGERSDGGAWKLLARQAFRLPS